MVDRSRRRDTTIAAALVGVGLAITAVLGLLRPEGVHHLDDLTHYMYAKWAWTWPQYLLDGWGRPGFTALHFLPAGIGWPACRVWSAVLTAATAWLAFRIGQRLNTPSAWVIVPFCYAQPLFFQLAQTTLTETALAFYLTFAVYLAVRGQWSWSAAALSLGMVTRHEAIIFLPIWVVFAWRGRLALWRLWPIVWAPLTANALALCAGLQPAVVQLIEPKPPIDYGHGGWLTFFVRAMEAWGPGITVLALAGIPFAWRKPGAALPAACIVAYFGVHTALRALGLFGSAGYARFLVPISPLVAIAALIGWHGLWSSAWRDRRKALLLTAAGTVLLWVAMERQFVLAAAGIDVAAELKETFIASWVVRIATAALVVLAVVSVAFGSRLGRHGWGRLPVPAVLLALVLLTGWWRCRPLDKPATAIAVEEAYQWLVENGYGDRETVTAHPWFQYATGRALPPHRPGVCARLERAPVGALFAWDAQFAGPAGLSLEALSSSPAFRVLHRSEPIAGERTPCLVILEKTGPWHPRAPAPEAAAE